MSKEFYSDYASDNFVKSIGKREFNLSKPIDGIYQEPHQMMISNWISRQTIYDSVLLYHGLGTGKTCTSISIAEGLKDWVIGNDKKIIILVKNSTLKDNYRSQLMTDCTNDAYLTKEEANVLYARNFKDKASKEFRIHSDKKNEVYAKTMKKIKAVYDFRTYETFVNSVNSGTVTTLNNTVIVVDEAHNVTNNKIYTALFNTLQKSHNYRLVLMTATPIADNSKEIFDISNLLNANNLDYIFPPQNQLVRNGLVEKHPGNASLKSEMLKLTDKAMKLISVRMSGKVSYIAENTDTFPEIIHSGKPVDDDTNSVKIVPCKMSDYQFDIYKKALGIDTNTNSGDSEESSNSLYKNSNDASTMVYPSGTFGKDGFVKYSNLSSIYTDLKKYSCKLHTMLKKLENPGTHFIYSNYVNYGGTGLVRLALLNNGYKESTGVGGSGANFVILSSDLSSSARNRYRTIFNSKENVDGKLIKILIGSPIMAEGVTLRNVRSVHILEPFWNMTKINQVVGRAARNHSHDNLPENQRYVKVYKYIAVHSTDHFYIDREKYILSNAKDRLNKNVERLLKTISFDCEISKDRNSRYTSNFNDGHAKCDYQECNYVCKLIPEGQNRDTYDLHYNFFNRFSLPAVRDKIVNLFKIYFVWKIDDIIDRLDVEDETVWNVLHELTESRDIITDTYNRKGFVINKYPFFIFNPLNKDINDSLFSKSLDFSKNMYTKVNTNEVESQGQSKTNRGSEDKGEGGSEENKNQKNKKGKIILTDDDKKFNRNLLSNQKILGTFRKRGTKITGRYGEYDGVFRVIYKKDNADDDDMRKMVSGMAITSFSSKDLKEISNKLGIKISGTNTDMTKNIKEYLISNNLVLR